MREIGVPGPDGAVIELEGIRLHTGQAPKLRLHAGRQDLAPYLIQFTGPIQSNWQASVRAAGGHIHGYVPQHTLSADLDAQAVGRLAKQSFVRAILPIEPDYKLQPFLRHLVSLAPAEAPAQIPVSISAYRPEDVAVITRALAALPVQVDASATGPRWGWVRATVPRDTILAVASLDRVQWVEEYVAPGWVNDRAVLTNYLNVAPVWQTHGLTGKGQLIGHADTGLDLGSWTNQHPDFTGRVAAAYALGRPGQWDDPHGHGTHTAGSILGAGTLSTGQFRGVAYEARLVHQSVMDSGGGLGGLPYNLSTLYLQAYTNGARIHSDSWGSSVYGAYSTYAQQSDEFMWDHPDMLLVFSAGNDGADSGDGVIDPDSMGSPATAKNLLTVGAAESGRAPGSGGYTSYAYGNLWPWDYPAPPISSDYVSLPYDGLHQGMAAFSSRGPTDDGRIKPDVVAPGTDIVSVRSRVSGASVAWGVQANANYTFSGGTSMAAPLAAGAAALVRQYFGQERQYASPSAALVKATLVHGARSLGIGQYGGGSYQELPGQTPNTVAGWGHIDVGNSLFPDQAAWLYVDEKTGLATPGETATHVFYATPGKVKITLNYTDYPALAGAGRKLVNNLDCSLAGPYGPVSAGPQDQTNTTEQLVATLGISGFYTARVQAVNIPSGPQPYALILSGSILERPVIEHDPLSNQYLTNTPYEVRARVTGLGTTGSEVVSLFWRAAGGSTNFTRVAMTRLTNDFFVGEIPAHPNPAQLFYYLSASNGAFQVTDPPAAPDTVHQFLVTRAFTLTVAGRPANILSVTPPYGTHLVASGSLMRISAPASSNITAGMRMAIAGWTGTGSIPAAGRTNELAVYVRKDSSLEWEWITQYALIQTSTVAGLVDTTTWWPAWSTASTVTAALEATVSSTAYGLAGWRIDGVRHPDATSPASNPATNLVVYGPRWAEAVYLPAAQDNNANGLPDWWEQFYFGSGTASPTGDDDGDGFTNAKEWQDRTHPRDAGSTPQPPAIAHLTLPDPQTSPAPWSVQARVMDNFAVSNVTLLWQRNGGAWTSMVLGAQSATNFGGMLPAPGTNSDTFAYRLEARDFAGLTAVNGPFSFMVRYPRLGATPPSLGVSDLLADQVTRLEIVITNQGLANLQWNLRRTLFHDHVENGTGTWVHAGQYDVWHINTGRSSSAHSAWHFGNGPGAYYPDAAHAWLDLEPVHLDAAAQLFFDHWARMEYDYEQMDDHYWDGAVVELSVDDGASYTMIEPVGGYPHRITDNPASPFAPDTPCYGETDGWQPAVFDLSAYAGQTVRIRFRFGADYYVTEEGWYLDNFRIGYADDASWTWLDVQSNGTVAAQQAAPAWVELDSTALALGERRSAVLVLEGNDPERPTPIQIPVALHNASREILVTCSTNGTVMPAGPVRVRAGDPLEVLASADTFYVIGQVFTNGDPMAGFSGMESGRVTWPAVQSNGTLHVHFTEKMAAGLVPEKWLFEHGLTNQVPDVEAISDQDGDGMVAWQEFCARTDPLDQGSVAMMILGLTPGQDGLMVQWLSFTNTNWRYDLEQASASLEAYVPVATNLAAHPPVNIFTHPSATDAGIFRVKVLKTDP